MLDTRLEYDDRFFTTEEALRRARDSCGCWEGSDLRLLLSLPFLVDGSAAVLLPTLSS